MCVRSHNVMIVSADTCKYNTLIIGDPERSGHFNIDHRRFGYVALKLPQFWRQTQALFATLFTHSGTQHPGQRLHLITDSRHCRLRHRHMSPLRILRRARELFTKMSTRRQDVCTYPSLIGGYMELPTLHAYTGTII